MQYVSERITNLKDFEETAAYLNTLIGMIEVSNCEKQRKELWQELKTKAKELNDFEFQLEKRKVDYCE